jgi:hypothetical protein
MFTKVHASRQESTMVQLELSFEEPLSLKVPEAISRAQVQGTKSRRVRKAVHLNAGEGNLWV